MRFFPYNKHFSAHCIYLFISHICRDEIAQSQIPCAIMIIPYLGKLYKLFVYKKPAVYLPTFLLYSFCRFRSEFCYYLDCSVFINLYTLHNPTNYDVIIISKWSVMAIQPIAKPLDFRICLVALFKLCFGGCLLSTTASCLKRWFINSALSETAIPNIPKLPLQTHL